MTSLGTLVRLRAVHRRLQSLIEPLDDEAYRRQFHPDLSPLGWHLGHCAFVENYWLHERIQGDDRRTAALHDDYIPWRSPKPERGSRLPAKEQLLAQVAQDSDENLLLLSGTGGTLRHDPLLENEYIEHFLIQHHGMHVETMLMVLTQRAITRHRSDYLAGRRLLARAPVSALRHLSAGEYGVGGEAPAAFDNELPAGRVRMAAFRIAREPVSNAEYLAFIEAGGYNEPAHWSEDGWQWREANGITHPDHWRQDARGWWYGIGVDGPQDLDPAAPVMGLSHYEASAYAAWAGARLPHEHEWEIACRLNLLEGTGHVWEWCANTFFPYEGYTPFPYDEYSRRWFDGRHYSLRGGSLYTRRDLRRATFRNFHEADKRHIFAGLRLAF